MQFTEDSQNDCLKIFKEQPEVQIQETRWSSIFINLISCSFQTAMGYVCLDIVLAISLHYVVQKSDIAASGVGFAYTVFSLNILPIGTGLNQSLNVHVSQALGANKQHLSKTYLQMTLYTHILYTVPLCLILYLLKTPFSYTFPQQDREELIINAWQYLPFLIFSYIFATELECFKSYMLAFEITTPFTFIHLTTTVLHIFWCQLFVQKFDMGVKGAGIALIITEISNLILLFIYLNFSKHKQLFTEFQWKINFKLSLLHSYIKSSLSIIGHIYLDYFVFFVLTFISMQLGSDLFYAQLAFSNTCSFYYRIPISLSLGLMTFIGQEMGRNNIKQAKNYAFTGVLIFFSTALLLMGLLFVLREQWALFYAPNSEVVRDAMFDTLPLFIIGCLIMDGFQGSMSGALKGIEKKELVFNSTLIIYFLMGLPLILLLTFPWGFDLKLKGIWFGFGIANTILSVIYVVSLISTDWQKQALLIHKKIQEQNNLDLQKMYKIENDNFIEMEMQDLLLSQKKNLKVQNI